MSPRSEPVEQAVRKACELCHTDRIVRRVALRLSVVAVGVLGRAVTVAAGSAAQPRTLAAHTGRDAASDTCRAPELAGLTLKKARVLAAQAGCKIRVVSGAGKLRRGSGRIPQLEPEQLIAGQVPRAGGQSHSIRVSLVPLCVQSALPGAPQGEPFVTAGPTELVSGLYLGGGPLDD